MRFLENPLGHSHLAGCETLPRLHTVVPSQRMAAYLHTKGTFTAHLCTHAFEVVLVIRCNLSELGERGLVQLVASGTWSGYHFETLCYQRPRQPVTSYTITAVPVSRGITGEYALAPDQSGNAWYNEHGLVSDCLAKRKLVKRKYR